MKNNIIIWLLVSFFAISPSFAQTPKTVAEIEAEIARKKQELLKTTDERDIIEIKSSIETLKIDIKEVQKIEKEAEKQRKAEEKKKKQADKEAEKQRKAKRKSVEENQIDGNNQNNFQGQGKRTDNKVQLIHTADGIISNENNVVSQGSTTDPSKEDQELRSKVEKLQKENESLRKQLSELLIGNFMQNWGEKPFSQFNEELFQNDIQEITKKLSKTPQAIQKLADDFSDYKKGVNCINSKYNEQSIKSVIGTIKNLSDYAHNTEKKKELTDLSNKLSDYKDIVGIFQDLINDVTLMPGINKKDTIERTFMDKDVVDPENIKFINSIPWLSKKLVEFKEELKTGKKNVQNEILHLLE